PLEFSAPRALYLDTLRSNERLIQSFKVEELPEVTPETRPELDRAEARYWVGRVYLRRDAAPDALIQLQHSARLDPSYLPTTLWEGVVYLRLRRAPEALARAQKVLEREPKNVDALVMAGLASGARGQFDEAVTFLERASKIDPASERVQRIMTRIQLSALSG